MFRTLILVASCLALVGCGADSDLPATFAVSGKVTYKGNPISDASIVLVPEKKENRGAVGRTAADGSFTLTTFSKGDGAIPGVYKVAVTATEAQEEVGATTGTIGELEDEEALYDGGKTSSKAPKSLLPKKYGNVATSGISHTVPAGESTLEIELK